MSDSVVSYGAEGLGEFEKRMIMRDYEFSRHVINDMYQRIFLTERTVALITIVILGFMISDVKTISEGPKAFSVVITMMIGIGGFFRCRHLLGIAKKTIDYVERIEKTVLVKSKLGLQRYFAGMPMYFIMFKWIQNLYWLALFLVNLAAFAIFVKMDELLASWNWI